MGKEWLYWVGGGGGGGGNSRSSTKRGRMGGEMKEVESASAGCMCAVFHLFQLHHFHFPSSHRNHSNTHPNIYPFLQEEATTTRGVEAPRNSLELEETAAMTTSASIPLPIKPEENLNFPVGIQIKTRRSKISSSKSKARLDDISSECSSCNSPGTKTPSVVARLMGLDLLPQCTSPSTPNPHIKSHLLHFDDCIAAGARSLPETPRISLSRRSDVERHRLSLQINNINEELGRRGRFKHANDSATRRSFGIDITNTNQSRRDENLLLPKPGRKNSKILSKHDDSNAQRLRALDHNKSKPTTHTGSKSSRYSSSRVKELPPRAAAVRNRRETNKLNLMNNKSKRNPSSCDINILQVKKGPSPLPTKLPQKQSQVSSKRSIQLSSKPSQSYNQLQLQLTPPQTVSPCSTNGGATAIHGGSSPDHRNYIQIILKHTGIINHVNPLAKWHTPSHPIDPVIFYHLEFKAAAVDGGNSVLSHRCNRKLIFQLVNELLAEILTPRFDLRRWISPVGDGGCFPLVDELCKKIDSFPAANCVVLEDIDSLIDKDLCKSRLNGYLGEEEKMVSEIGSEIVEWLVREAVAVMGGDAAEEQTETCIWNVGL